MKICPIPLIIVVWYLFVCSKVVKFCALTHLCLFMHTRITINGRLYECNRFNLRQYYKYIMNSITYKFNICFDVSFWAHSNV